jgi:hypothetical protein
LRDPGLGLTEKIKARGKVIKIARMSGEELDEAELTIYRQLQMERYPKAFETLQLGLPIHRKEKMAALGPVWDQRDQLIRISGRVILALRDKHIDPPILLPDNHQVVTFLIRDKHESLIHAGVKTTLSELKERFWIVKGRQQTKKVWFACKKCRKLSSPPFSELAAPLPLNRLRNPQAFNVTGTDFAGPLYYKVVKTKKKRKAKSSTEADSNPEPLAEEEAPKDQGLEPSTDNEAPIEEDLEPLAEEEAPTEPIEEDLEPLADEEAPTEPDEEEIVSVRYLKCYVCLFTCAVTRAVHLELITDMTARSFLLAFRRFAARRGPVSIMYSDNAQTFRCIERHLSILQADPTVQDFLARKKLLWIYSASLAPWWGGFWERMVRSVKDLLRRSNGRACLAYDELEASLIEIESVINARPLNYISDGPDEPLPITPNQFLNNRRSTCATPEPAVNLMAPTSTSIALVALDKDRREYVSNICARFVEDYLFQLDNFQTKGKSGRKIRLGEVVLIHDEHTKRLMWSTGLVTELRPSRDGLVRSVVLRTPNGKLINRAIQCLYPLEVCQDNPEDIIDAVATGPELEDVPAPPEQAPFLPDPAPDNPDPAVGNVEPDEPGSGGEYVGNIMPSQQPTTRSGRRSRKPRHLDDYCLRGPR